jgi:hypothetical protein
MTSLASLRDTQPAPTVNTASLFFSLSRYELKKHLGAVAALARPRVSRLPQGPALTWKRRSRSHCPERKGREVEPSETRARSWFQTRQRASQRELYGLACLAGQRWASNRPATGQPWVSWTCWRAAVETQRQKTSLAFMHSVSRACCQRLVLVLDRVKQQAWQTDMVGWTRGATAVQGPTGGGPRADDIMRAALTSVPSW